jgi:hypothetical protein
MKANAQKSPALITDGNNEADIAAPTIEAVLSTRMPTDIIVPDGTEISRPNHKDLN